jgi:DNA-binding HxlR family transcriptional regulator
MSERSYNQYCAIAHALDLIGDRWALLILRDLILGPKRFTDLRAGLPGIGTNILTARLKDLEQAGVLRRRYLPPPAASTVYELTPYGAELRPTLSALARWGGKTLGPVQPNQLVSPDGIRLTVSSLAGAMAKAGVRGSYAIRVRDVSVDFTQGIHIGDDGLVTLEPEASLEPAVTLDTDPETLVGIAVGRESLRAAVARDAVRLDGEPEPVERILAAGT